MSSLVTGVSWGLRASRLPSRDADLGEGSYKWSPLFFFFVIALGVLVAPGKLHLGYPAIAVALAYHLYRRAPVTYVSFVWWLWFLSPFVRRVVDYRSGWMDPNPILLAPPLASIVCFPTLIKSERQLWQSGARPFLLALGAVCYGFVIGIPGLPIRVLLAASLSWLAPLVFGFYLYSIFRSDLRSHSFAQSIQRTFTWGVITMGAYGAAQLVLAPAWDAMWMAESQIGSIGTPEPFAIRVFSTMNAPAPLGIALAAGLLLQIGNWHWRGLLACLLGTSSLLLTMSRTSWLIFSFGALALSLRQKGHNFRGLPIFILLVVCSVLTTAMSPIGDELHDRFQSLWALKDDASYQDRQSGYDRIAESVAHLPIGGGLGYMELHFGAEGSDQIGPHDIAILEIFLSLGWLGGAAYLGAMLLALKSLLATGSTCSKLEAATANSISIGLLSQGFLCSLMLGVSGAILWAFMGLYLGMKARDQQMIKAQDAILIQR